MAIQGLKFFQKHHVKVLIPDNSLAIWDNYRMIHGRSCYQDTNRHLTRYWIKEICSSIQSKIIIR